MSIFYEFKDVLGDFHLCILNIENDYQPSEQIAVPDNIKNPYKRIQYAAAREALLHIDPDFSLQDMQVSETGKPFIPEYDKSFSLSHSSNYAAAMIAQTPNCGFDIELPGKKISSIKDKFVAREEFKNIEDSLRQFFPSASEFIFYGICWSAKESVYKWMGRREIDFKANMELFPSRNDFNTHIPYLNCRIKIEGEEERVIPVYIQWKKPLVVTWALGSN